MRDLTPDLSVSLIVRSGVGSAGTDIDGRVNR
jgi:hypothetical protein